MYYVRTYVCMYVRMYACLCMYVCVYVRMHLRIYYLSIYPSIQPSIHPSIRPSTYLSIFVSIYLSVCLSTYATPNTNYFHWYHNSSTGQSVPLCDLQGISSSSGDGSNRNSSMHSGVVYRCRLSQVPQYPWQTAVLYPDNGGSSKTSVPLCQITRCHILKRNTDRCFATVNSTA
jgi:hypothetical protein